MISVGDSSPVQRDNDRAIKPQGQGSNVSMLVTGTQANNLGWREALLHDVYNCTNLKQPNECVEAILVSV